MKRNVQFEARVKIRILKIHSPFSIFPPLSPSFFHPSPSLPPLLFLSFIASRFSLFVAVVKKSCPFNTRRVTSMKEPAECSRIKRSNCATGYHRLEQSDKKRESKAGTKRARDRSREREISRKFLNKFLDLELKFESSIHFDDETEFLLQREEILQNRPRIYIIPDIYPGSTRKMTERQRA